MDKVYVLYARYEDSENFDEFVVGVYRSKSMAEDDKHALETDQTPVNSDIVARLNFDRTSNYGYRIEEFPLMSISHAYYKKYVSVVCADKKLLQQIQTLYSQYRYKSYDLDFSRYFASYVLQLHIPGNVLDELIDEWGMVRVKENSYRSRQTYIIPDNVIGELSIKLKEETTCQNTQ